MNCGKIYKKEDLVHCLTRKLKIVWRCPNCGSYGKFTSIRLTSEPAGKAFYKCSQCGEIFGEGELIILYINGREVKRCPNCGAYGKFRKVKHKL
jgi:DNA-directed RNA polymerase subunit RPC12/RpoP